MIGSSNNNISEYQWMLFARLLERHYGVNEALEILINLYPKNKHLEELANGLEAGVSFKELLNNDRFEKELAFYIDYLPLSQSIVLVNTQQKKREGLRKQLIGKVSYQLILVVASGAILILFDRYVLPMMASSVGEATSRTDNLIKMFDILNKVLVVLFVVVVIALVFFLMVRLGHKETYLWMFLHQFNKDKIIKDYVAYRFAIKLNCLLQQGVPLIEAINIIRYDRQDSMVALLAHHFDESLVSGVEFEDSLDNEMFPSDFHSMCMWGLKGENFSEALTDYEVLYEADLERRLKTMSTILQAVCYGFTGLIIVMAYQVLMLPLEMLEAF